MRRTSTAVVAVSLAAVAACSSTASVTPQKPSAGPASHFTDWPNYHRTPAKSGLAQGSVRLPLHAAWTRKLDGGVWSEPVIADGVLIAATERNSVYGLNPQTGKILWHQKLALAEPLSSQPCGDIDPLGITGSPAYDPATGSVFVVDTSPSGHHTVWALSAKTGHRRWHRSGDIRGRDMNAEQQRSALLVVDHRVIVTYGGHDGDCGNYVGYAMSIATDGKGRTPHYAVPTAREAGMWSPAGPVVGPTGNVYVAAGNGASTSGGWDRSDSVTELAPASMRRLAVFAPSTWAQDNAADLDLGSSSPLPVGSRIVIAGKRGTVYLLSPNLGGIGGQLATASGCQAFGGGATTGSLAIMPCTSGVRALSVGADSLTWRWSADGIFGSPVVAGKRVFVADRNSGSLKVLSLATGQVVTSVPISGSLPTFPSEVVDGNHVFVPTRSGITAIRGS
ncbi:MAG TPA: PQQ-binding-like beta-propeller repeat protein [Mycobacteriales bacterium]|nr:PQQ-binding-like beta-propeller repeat protein [Mycobacteriales bacterium]